MRSLAMLALCPVLLFGCGEGQTEKEAPAAAGSQAAVETPTIKAPAIVLTALTDERVEVGCGMCIYEMPGVEGCKTAAMVAGQPVLLLGVGAEAHSLGLCNGAKNAVVTASVEDGQLVASKMEIE